MDQLQIPFSPRTPSAFLSSLILSPRPDLPCTSSSNPNGTLLGRATSGFPIPQSIISILSPILPSGFPSLTHELSDPNQREDEIKPSTPVPKIIYRPLTPVESKQLAQTLLCNFEPIMKIKNNSVKTKELMSSSIELAKKLDECKIQWDKQRKVMGIHLRGLWEMNERHKGNGKGKAKGKGKGMGKKDELQEDVNVLSLYIQKSFVTTADEPHPLDPAPLDLPMPQLEAPSTIPKHTIQAGLLTALPININPSSSSSRPHGHRSSISSITSIKSVITRAVSPNPNPAPLGNNKQVIVAPAISQTKMPLANSSIAEPKSILNNGGDTDHANLKSPSSFYYEGTQSGLGGDGNGGTRVTAKLSERQYMTQQFRERKKSVGLMIKIDDHKSQHPLSSIAYQTAHSLKTGLTPRSTRTPFTGHTAFTPKSTHRRFGNGTPRFRKVGEPRHSKAYTPKLEVKHQTGKYQTTLIQPFSAITAPVPPSACPSALKSAHSITYNRKKIGFGLGLRMDLRLGGRRYSFGGGDGTKGKISGRDGNIPKGKYKNNGKGKGLKSGKRLRFDGWELR